MVLTFSKRAYDKSMNKALLIPLLALSCAFGDDFQFLPPKPVDSNDALINTSTKIGIELDVMGRAWHSNKYAEYNDVNPGLGIDMTFEVNPVDHALIAFSMGQYRDSFSNQADYMLIGPRWLLFGDYSTFHGTFGAEVGMLNGSGNKGIALIPCVSLGWKMFDLCAIGNYHKDNNGQPNQDGSINRNNCSTSMVGVFLRIHLLTFQNSR